MKRKQMSTHHFFSQIVWLFHLFNKAFAVNRSLLSCLNIKVKKKNGKYSWKSHFNKIYKDDKIITIIFQALFVMNLLVVE